MKNNLWIWLQGGKVHYIIYRHKKQTYEAGAFKGGQHAMSMFALTYSPDHWIQRTVLQPEPHTVLRLIVYRKLKLRGRGANA